MAWIDRGGRRRQSEPAGHLAAHEGRSRKAAQARAHRMRGGDLIGQPQRGAKANLPLRHIARHGGRVAQTMQRRYERQAVARAVGKRVAVFEDPQRGATVACLQGKQAEIHECVLDPDRHADCLPCIQARLVVGGGGFQVALLEGQVAELVEGEAQEVVVPRRPRARDSASLPSSISALQSHP